ncbi:MAG TPA: hypothetical protein VFV05_12385 [Methylomirabilota bacterium]|nr:hypothetical protein [Methylomirabilota bacterium]
MSETATRRRRGLRLAAAFAAPTLVAVLAVAAVAVVAGPGTLLALVPARQVPVPADDAAPVVVVRAYLDALDAHDLDTARAVLTPERRVAVEQSQGNWFVNLRSVRNVRLDPAVDAPHSRGAYRQAVRVPAELDVTLFFETAGREGGSLTWGFVLVRNGPEEPWRIADEGPA